MVTALKKGIFFSLVLTSMGYSMQLNYGYTASYNASINTDNYSIMGTLKAFNSAKIQARTFSGSGTIDSNQITIVCDEFNFTGTIICNGTCLIYTKKAFDPTQFKKEGTGNFTITVTSQTIEDHTQTSLQAKGKNVLLSQVDISEEQINKNISDIRYNAKRNALDEKRVITELKNEADEQACYHATRLNQNHDEQELTTALTYSAVGCAGLGLAAATYLYKDAITGGLQPYISLQNDSVPSAALTTAIVSIFPLVFSVKHFQAWLNPQHKEKHATLSLVSKKLNDALQTPYTPEEQIITLH